MAENNEELNKIKQITSAEQLLETIEGKADPFAGYSLEELQAIAGVINGFGASKAKEAVMAMLNAEISKQQNALQPTQSESHDNQPSSADSPQQEVKLPNVNLLNQPSYSLYKAFSNINSAILRKDENLDANAVNARDAIVDTAQKMLDMANIDEITPENAVLLKDYINIIRDFRTFDSNEKEKMDALETKVDEQLKIFDKENGLEILENVSAEELATRETRLHNIADTVIKNKTKDTDLSASQKENIEVIKNLVIQEMKTSPLYPSDEIIERIAREIKASKDVVEEIIKNHDAGKELNSAQKEVYDAVVKLTFDAKANEFDTRFEELKAQLEYTKDIERAKLSAEELYPIKDGMSDKEQAEILKKRTEYIADNTPKSEEKWIEEQALKAFKEKYADKANLSDDEIKGSKEYEDIKGAYAKMAQRISDSANTAYVIRTDLLANRTARITKSPDIHPKTKTFLQDFAKNHPDLYGYGKVALVSGKKVLLTQLINHVAGLNGLAVYSAYNTYKSVNKAYKEYLQKGGKKGFGNFIAYLRKPENREKRIDLLKQAAMSGIAISAAVVDNVAGFGIGGAVLGPAIKRIGNGIVSTGAETVKLFGNLKEWNKARKSGDKDAQKAASKKLKKSWLGLGVAVAGVVGLGFLGKHLMGDSDENKLSDFDEKLLKDSDGKGFTNEEREQFLKNVENMKNNGNGDITDPLNMKGGENGVSDNTTSENGSSDNTTSENSGNDATENVPEVLQLSEADVKLMVTDCKMGPDPIVAKLEQMGVLSAEDKAQLIASGGRRDGVASRVLASYLGHPYDNTEVPVHANLTPEQQQELNQYLRSEEYQQECDKCNAAATARRLAKARQMAENQKENANGDASSNTTVETKDNNANGDTEEKKVIVGVQVNTNKAFAGITTKHNVASDVQNVESKGDPRVDQRNAAIAQHQATGAIHMNTQMVDENGKVVSSGNYTVRGNVENNSYTVSGKVVSGNQVHKENIKVEGDVTESRYSNGVVIRDIDGDGQSDSIVRTVKVNDQEFAAVKGTGGKTYLMDEKGNIIQDDKAVKRVKEIAKTARDAKMGRE